MSTSSLRLPQYNAPIPTHKPYVLEADEGETLSVIGGQMVRYLATKEQTDNAFGLIHSRGKLDEKILPHFHKAAQDTWLVLKGALQLWAGDQSRILYPGDFAYVPPGIVHSYQVVGHDTEYMGLITPGDWIKFFKVLGIPCDDTPTYKSLDDRTIDKRWMIEQIKAGHDIIPQPQYQFCEVNGQAGGDTTLPKGSEAYFLRSDTAAKYFLNGQTCTPMCRAANSDNNFSVATIAAIGPKTKYPTFTHGKQPFASGAIPEGKTVKFETTNIAFRIIEGKFDFEITNEDGTVHKETAISNETVMITAGFAFRYSVSSAYGRMYSFAGKGSGLEEVFIALGRLGQEHEMVGEAAGEELDLEKAEAALKSIGASLV